MPKMTELDLGKLTLAKALNELEAEGYPSSVFLTNINRQIIVKTVKSTVPGDSLSELLIKKLLFTKNEVVLPEVGRTFNVAEVTYCENAKELVLLFFAKEDFLQIEITPVGEIPFGDVKEFVLSLLSAVWEMPVLSVDLLVKARA